MADRDGTSADPQHPSIQRYVEAQKRYFATCVPQQRAGLLIDNSVIKGPAAAQCPAAPFPYRINSHPRR